MSSTGTEMFPPWEYTETTSIMEWFCVLCNPTRLTAINLTKLKRRINHLYFILK